MNTEDQPLTPLQKRGVEILAQCIAPAIHSLMQATFNCCEVLMVEATARVRLFVRTLSDEDLRKLLDTSPVIREAKP